MESAAAMERPQAKLEQWMEKEPEPGALPLFRHSNRTSAAVQPLSSFVLSRAFVLHVLGWWHSGWFDLRCCLSCSFSSDVA